MTTLSVPWPHDGAQELRVEVDHDTPEYGPIEKGVRSAASVTSSHGGLRFMLEVNLGDGYDVEIGPTVAGVTKVELKRR